MSRNDVRDKKNLIITIIVIVLIAAVAAGLFLFITLYDFGGTNRSGSDHTTPIDTYRRVRQTTLRQILHLIRLHLLNWMTRCLYWSMQTIKCRMALMMVW